MLAEMAVFQQADVDDQLLQSVVDSLPGQAQLFQIGMMASRTLPVVRVCVNRLPARDVPDWLNELNWCGDTAALAGILDALDPLLHTMAIDLDLTAEGVAKRIGLECYMDWSNEQSDQWLPLLDYTEHLNLCVPSKCSGILEFPGHKGSFTNQPQQCRGIVYPMLIRNIHHLKFSILADRILEAKAYLGVYRPGLNYDQIYGYADAPSGQDAWIIE
jgi:hypothetical protein